MPAVRVAKAVPLPTGAVHAVRQQQDEARLQAPLGLAAADVGVEHDLGAVEEVSELRLPQHQVVRRLAGEAVLEAQDRLLGQRTVGNLQVTYDRELVSLTHVATRAWSTTSISSCLEVSCPSC